MQDEWEHGSGQRAEHDDADQGGADRQRDQHPVLAVVVEAQILPQRNAHDADKAQHRPESQSVGDFPQRHAPPVLDFKLAQGQCAYQKGCGLRSRIASRAHDQRDEQRQHDGLLELAFVALHR